MPIWLTLILGAALSTVPSLLPMIPAPYNSIATAILSLGNGVYHLFQPPPNS